MVFRGFSRLRSFWNVLLNFLHYISCVKKSWVRLLSAVGFCILLVYFLFTSALRFFMFVSYLFRRSFNSCWRFFITSRFWCIDFCPLRWFSVDAHIFWHVAILCINLMIFVYVPALWNIFLRTCVMIVNFYDLHLISVRFHRWFRCIYIISSICIPVYSWLIFTCHINFHAVSLINVKLFTIICKIQLSWIIIFVNILSRFKHFDLWSLIFHRCAYIFIC